SLGLGLVVVFSSGSALTQCYPLSLHDALPISPTAPAATRAMSSKNRFWLCIGCRLFCRFLLAVAGGVLVDCLLDCGRRLAGEVEDRKSTRLNSSHQTSSYAVFCMTKKI